MKKHAASLMLFFMLYAICTVNAQEPKQVVINLNTGYQVKGEVLEQTSTGIKVKALNGEVYEYKSDEIKNIQDAKQPSSSKPNKPFSSAKKGSLPIQEGNKPQVGQGIFSYHFGPSIPTGHFADTNRSGAGLGLNIGIQYLYPLTEQGLSLFAGIDANYNGIKKGKKDAIVKSIDNSEDVTYPKYFNIPFSSGLHYTFQLNEKISFYGKGGLIASFLKITDFKFPYNGNELKTKFNLSTKVGFTLGGGLILNDKIDIAITYWHLGEHEIRSVSEYPGETEKENFDFDDSLFTLAVGFKF